MKDTLIEIKNNLQGTRVEWMKLRIKSMIWNIRKQKTTNQTKKKKKTTTPNEDSVSSQRDDFKHSNNCTIGVPEGEEKEQDWKPIWKNNERKLP